MKNDLNRLGENLTTDKKENQQNTRRIKANLPLIERKLDVVSSGYNFKMEIPLTQRDTSAFLNLYIKPDNCCECLQGTPAAAREGWATIASFKDFTYIQGDPVLPPEGILVSSISGPLSDGIEHQALIENITTIGTLDSPWFAYPGFPWFYLRGGYVDFYTTNQFEDFMLVDGAISVPTDGVYVIRYRNRATGATTDTSKITASIQKYAENNAGVRVWDTIVRKTYSNMQGNLCWGTPEVCADAAENGGFIIDLDLYALCYPLNAGDLVAGFLKAEDVSWWNPSTGQSTDKIEISLIGLGYGIIAGYIYDNETREPLEGVTLVLGFSMAQEMTDADGAYTFYHVMPGTQTITASYSGYSTITQDVTVTANKISRVDFLLVHT